MAQFKKIKLLVANRSEIACRIFQAARELGLITVGIYCEDDQDSRHLTEAQELYRVKSYLDIPSILKAVSDSGAKLVHPGYGFLSENQGFVSELEKQQILFVGPKSQSIRDLGSKSEAKKWMDVWGIPTLPWVRVSNDFQSLKREAKKMGYPVLIKAAHGGGGKGMRRVNEEKELEFALKSAQEEASHLFKDASVLLEKALTHARHIEVQIFGDGKGGGGHFFERDCSLQRRNQKIWEESPSVHLTDETKEKMFEYALTILKNSKYQNAGTLEFLVDQNGQPFFLEVNTRLQVEHPVTEWVTGVDLVRAQIQHTLWGECPKFPQSIKGHSIEVRLLAEDPWQGDMPALGLIQKLRWPTGLGIRIESGIEEGQRITPFYDSMLAKLSVYAESRALALDRLRYALSETVILGLGSNQHFLQKLAENTQIQKGGVPTSFLAETQVNFEMTQDQKEWFHGVSSQKGTPKKNPENISLPLSPWSFYK